MDNIDKNKVSVIVPCYNNDNTICECIKSIINQRYTNFEVIIVDDGSDNPVSDILYQHFTNLNNIYIYRQKHKGTSAARNLGLENANGEYIMFCDADDIVAPIWISKMVSNDADYSLCRYLNKEISKSSWVKNYGDCISWLLSNYLYTTRSVCTKCFKSSIIVRFNIRFDEDLYCYEDSLFLFYYLLRLDFDSKVSYVNERLYFYNTNETGMHTKVNEEQEKLFYERMKEFLGKATIDKRLENIFKSYIENSYFYYKLTRLVRENKVTQVTALLKNNKDVLNFKNLKNVSRFRERVFVALKSGKLYCMFYNFFGK